MRFVGLILSAAGIAGAVESAASTLIEGALFAF
jgi:hypothetical protein